MRKSKKKKKSRIFTENFQSNIYSTNKTNCELTAFTKITDFGNVLDKKEFISKNNLKYFCNKQVWVILHVQQQDVLQENSKIQVIIKSKKMQCFGLKLGRNGIIQSQLWVLNLTSIINLVQNFRKQQA